MSSYDVEEYVVKPNKNRQDGEINVRNQIN